LIAFTRLSTSDFGLIIGSFYGLLAAQSISYLFRSNEPNWSDSTHHRTFIGHSLGGFFVVYTLLNKPDLFSNYIAISPSLWWDENSILDNSKTFLKENPQLNQRLYLSIGNEAGGHIGDRYFTSVKDLSNSLEANAPKLLEWEFKHMPNESHGTIPHRAIYNSLEDIYRGWDFGDIFTLLRNEDVQTIDTHFQNLSKKYGFKVETPEHIINRFGYRFMRNNKYDKAVDIFTRNTQNHPNSANAFSSLGEAYEKMNNLGLAYTNYKKARGLGVLYSDPNLPQIIKDFERLENIINSQK